MNEIIINGMPLSIKEYEGVRVVTFKDIDMCHKRPEGTARKRFNDNKKHFVEGEDFYKISPSEFRTAIGDMDKRQQNDVTLITESGYYMLVKSFTDDLSWDVQRQLVNSYFKVERPQPVQQLSPMEMIAAMANNAVEMERRLKEAENKVAETSSKLEQALDVFANDTLAMTDWAGYTSRKINSICKQNHLSNQSEKGRLYKELEATARCNLAKRVTEKQKRMKKAGAKYADWKNVAKLDVISDDPKLRVIFDGIVKKFEAKYIQGDNVQMGLVEIQ